MSAGGFMPLARASARDSLFWQARVSLGGRIHIGVLEGRLCVTRCGMWLEPGRCFVRPVADSARPVMGCARCYR